MPNGYETNDFSPSARSGNESEMLKSEERKEESNPASKRVVLKKPTKSNASGKKSGLKSQDKNVEDDKKASKMTGGSTVKEIEKEREKEEIHAALRNFRTLAELNKNFSQTAPTEKSVNQMSPRQTGRNSPGLGKFQ